MFNKTYLLSLQALHNIYCYSIAFLSYKSAKEFKHSIAEQVIEINNQKLQQASASEKKKYQMKAFEEYSENYPGNYWSIRLAFVQDDTNHKEK